MDGWMDEFCTYIAMGDFQLLIFELSADYLLKTLMSLGLLCPPLVMTGSYHISSEHKGLSSNKLSH